MLSAASVSPVPGLRTSTQVGVGWRFARALDSLGRVGLDGPVSACGRDTEGCLNEAQAELFGSEGSLLRAEIWLRTALERLLGAGFDELEEEYLLTWQARLAGLLWVARGRADQSLRVLVAGLVYL